MQTVITEIAAGTEAADTAAQAAGVSAAPSDSPPDGATITEDTLIEAYEELLRQKRIYDECSDTVARLKTNVETEVTYLGRKLAEAESLEQALVKREEAVQLREDHVFDRELEIRGGLQEEAARHREALAEAAKRASDLLRAEREEFADAQRRDRDEQHRLLDEERESNVRWLDKQRTELERQRNELLEERQRVDADKAAVEALRQGLARQEETIRQQVEARAAEDLLRLELQLQTAQAHNELAQREISSLNERLASRELAWLELGNRSPERVLADLKAAKQQVEELSDQLASRLSDDSLDRLRSLEEENRYLHQQRAELDYEVNQLRAAGLNQRINAMQLKQLNDTRQQFEVIVKGYENQIGKLQATLTNLTDEQQDLTAPTFPRCVDLDDDPRLTTPGPAVDDPPDLTALVHNLQGAIWRYADRSYELSDLRSFLGGMAMSHLHLLQGISGIGKTSLPIAVATALSFPCTVVEVQAGWRDQQDLFGQYNTFERKFHESRFLTALYQAHLPFHAHRPFFIVLDEMNLSRPEQYFSSVLSKLENPDDEAIELVPKAQGRLADKLFEGRGIKIPPNVWFIGTANHDESTLDFADKTYNRAYVLELPPTRPVIAPDAPARVDPLSVVALRKAFDIAAEDHATAAEKVRSLLIEQLAPELQSQCQIGISPRIIDQLDTYVPVVVAAGADDPDGALTEAADQFIAMKVLRKIRGRYEILPDVIRELAETVNTCWELSDVPGKPRLCQQVLRTELHLRGDG